MAIPIIQQIRVGAYILKQKLLGRKRYPLVLMLEPQFKTNLVTTVCGKSDYPQKVLDEYVLSGNFYISRKDSLDRNKNFTSKKTYGFVIKKKYYTDIDDHLDLKFANLLCKLNKK